MHPINAKVTRKGFIPVMLTPFKQDGAIDFPMLTELTKFYLTAGASGLFANCLSSEMFDLTPNERLSITKHVVKSTNNGTPVVATGNFGRSIPDQADFVKRMFDTGVESVILVTSLIAEQTESDEVFTEKVMRLLDLTGNIPVGLYECPYPYKRIVGAEQLKLFLSTGRLTFFKDTCLDLEKVKVKVNLAKAYDFRIYDAYMVHAVESLRAGTDGLSCIQGNYFPELIVWLCENYNHSDLNEEVTRVQQFLKRNMEVMHTAYPTAAKYFLQKRGMKISTFSRTGNVEANDALKQPIDVLFDQWDDIKMNLNGS